VTVAHIKRQQVLS